MELSLSPPVLAAAIGCLVMGIVANYPIALAPGMGLKCLISLTRYV